MFSTAKLFQNGQSQAVRLPKKFRFENIKEVFIKKVGNSIVLTPKNENSWNDFFENLDNFKGKIERKELEIQERKYFE